MKAAAVEAGKTALDQRQHRLVVIKIGHAESGGHGHGHGGNPVRVIFHTVH
jgi:hypothetical protein